jgi:uncharacterized protein (TIRG00374 family)
LATAASNDNSQESGPSHRRLLIGIVIAVVVIGILVVALDWKQARQVLITADWTLLVPALLASGLSYLLLNIAFALVSRSWGIELHAWRLIEIGFVSTVLNHLVTAGGAPGYAVRVLHMRRPGISTKQILAISLFHIYLSLLVLMAMLPIATLYLLLNTSLSPAATAGLGAIVAGMVIALGVAGALVFSDSLRTRLLGLAGRLWHKLTHHDVSESLASFSATMAEGVTVFRRRPRRFAVIMGLIVADWASSMAALWLCFAALGSSLGLGVLFSGFTLGITAGLASMIPGGLGVQEGSMAGIYHLLGIPLHQSVLAAVLFRVVYYFIPYLVSLIFHWHLLRQMGEAGGAPDNKEVSRTA